MAVEISFTVNGRDTTRALRNAGVQADDRIRERIDAGEVSWYRLDQHSL